MGTRIVLTKEEVEELERYRTENHQARDVLVATALLRMDEGEFTSWHWTDRKTAAALDVCRRSLENWKRKLQEKGVKAVFELKRRPNKPK